MELIQNALIIIVAVLIAFWYFGGFKLIRFFKIKNLKKSLINPLDAEAITSIHKAYASGSPLPTKLSFTEYAILKRLNEKDKWAKSAYENAPDNPVAAYFYAGFLIAEMSALRGTSTIDKLTSDQVSRIREKLDDAEKIIQIFANSKLSPADATAMFVDVYIHLGKPAQIDAVMKLNANYLEGRLDVVSRYLRSLYPRWGGSHELLQQKAEEFSAQGGPLLAAKAIAYCHLMEDRDIKDYKALIKIKPVNDWINAYEKLPKTPAVINSCEHYNLLMAHKLFAKFFLYINDKKHLKQAIINTAGHFSADEAINPNSQGQITFSEMLDELGITSFS